MTLPGAGRGRGVCSPAAHGSRRRAGSAGDLAHGFQGRCARRDALPGRRWFMRSVVVTGLGVVARYGVGKDAFWSACVEGRSGVRPIRSFDSSGHPVKIGAEVPEFDLLPFVPPAHRKSLKIMGRAARFGVAAAGLAVEDSGLTLSRED